MLRIKKTNVLLVTNDELEERIKCTADLKRFALNVRVISTFCCRVPLLTVEYFKISYHREFQTSCQPYYNS